MPRSPEQNEQVRKETAEKITQASMKVFAELGFKATTMKKIAQATGLSYGLVYHYFPSKDDLFRHLVDQSLDMSARTLKQGLESQGSPQEKLERLAQVMARELAQEDSYFYFVIMLQALTQAKSLPGLMDHIHGRSALHYQLLLPVVAEAQALGFVGPGNPQVLCATFFAFVQGIALLCFQEKDMRQLITPSMFLKQLQ